MEERVGAPATVRLPSVVRVLSATIAPTPSAGTAIKAHKGIFTHLPFGDAERSAGSTGAYSPGWPLGGGNALLMEAPQRYRPPPTPTRTFSPGPSPIWVFLPRFPRRPSVAFSGRVRVPRTLRSTASTSITRRRSP